MKLSGIIAVILALFLFSTAVGMSVIVAKNLSALVWTTAPVKFKCSSSNMLPRNIHENVLSIHFAEADTEEDVELLIVNRNTSTKLSKSDVLKVLKKANLTGRGFKKEVSYQTVKSDGSSTYFKASIAIFA